jgi:hypothetical protein
MHSTDNLEDGYLGSGKQLQWSIKKHGKEKHIRDIIEHCLDRPSLVAREKYLIDDELIANPGCMNMARGGEGGYVIAYTDERRAKLSAKMKGIPQGPMAEETKKKLSILRMGKHLTNECKANMSKTLKGKVFSEETKRKISEAKKGVPLSQANKEALSVSCKGRVTSEETRKKLSLAAKGKPKSDETKCNMSLGSKGKPKSKQHVINSVLGKKKALALRNINV